MKEEISVYVIDGDLDNDQLKEVSVDHMLGKNISNILLPTTKTYLKINVSRGCEVAKKFGAKIFIMHVIASPIFLATNTSTMQREKDAEEILEEAKKIALDEGVEFELRVVHTNSIFRAIMDFLNEGIDLLLLGALDKNKASDLGSQLVKEFDGDVWFLTHD